MIARGALVVLAVLAARADAKGCHEHSHVVGLEHCSQFADWSIDDDVPPLRVELAMFHTGFAVEPFMLGGTGARAVAPDRLATTANGGMLRVVGDVAGRFYVGGELAIGGLGVLPRLEIPDLAGIVYFAPRAIGGWHVTFARFGLGAEVATGMRLASFGMCPTTKCAELETQADAAVQLRVSADIYVAPRFSLGVRYGHGVVPVDEQELAFYFSIHVRPMDGAP